MSALPLTFPLRQAMTRWCRDNNEEPSPPETLERLSRELEHELRQLPLRAVRGEPAQWPDPGHPQKIGTWLNVLLLGADLAARYPEACKLLERLNPTPEVFTETGQRQTNDLPDLIRRRVMTGLWLGAPDPDHMLPDWLKLTGTYLRMNRPVGPSTSESLVISTDTDVLRALLAVHELAAQTTKNSDSLPAQLIHRILEHSAGTPPAHQKTRISGTGPAPL